MSATRGPNSGLKGQGFWIIGSWNDTNTIYDAFAGPFVNHTAARDYVINVIEKGKSNQFRPDEELDIMYVNVPDPIS